MAASQCTVSLSLWVKESLGLVAARAGGYNEVDRHAQSGRQSAVWGLMLRRASCRLRLGTAVRRLARAWIGI